MLKAIGDIAALLLLIAAVGFTARAVSHMGRAPAPVRNAATRTAAAVRHPVRAVRTGAPKASGTEAIWAKARADDWLERRRASRARKDERRANRPPGGRRSWLPRTVISMPPGVIGKPAVTGQPPSGPKAVPALVPQPSPATTPAVKPREADPLMPIPRGNVTPHHAAVNAYVASFEPESDGDLIRFMNGEAAGMAGYAQAMEQLQEHLLSSVGLDPAAVQGLTEFGQAVTEAAALMTRASAKFQGTYQGVRETVAGGTVLPFKGRWVTGESA